MNREAIGAVVLAAGGSSRLGQPKQFLRHEGETLLHRTAAAAAQAGCSPVIVVAGSDYDRVKLELASLNVHVKQHTDWQRGIGSSIRKGIAGALLHNPALAAIIILVCDQPFISRQTIQNLVLAREQTGKPAIASAYAGTIGVPALFDRSLFPLLAEIADWKGAKTVLASLEQKTANVTFPEGAIDIDTPAAVIEHLKD